MNAQTPEDEFQRRSRRALLAAQLDTILNSFTGLFLIGLLLSGTIQDNPNNARAFGMVTFEIAGPMTRYPESFAREFTETLLVDGSPPLEDGGVTPPPPLSHMGPEVASSAIRAWPYTVTRRLSLANVSPPFRLTYELNGPLDALATLQVAIGVSGSLFSEQVVAQLQQRTHPFRRPQGDGPGPWRITVTVDPNVTELQHAISGVVMENDKGGPP